MSLYTVGAASDNWDGWIWPVPIWNDRDPEISDHFQREVSSSHRQHLGADIMFRRLASEPANKLPSTSGHFAMPAGVPVLSAGPGKVYDFGLTSRGHFVIIDHGKVNGRGMVTKYQHLAKLSPHLVKGKMVPAGTYLGDVGGDLPPHYILRHLHFEVWYPSKGSGREQWVTDPKPLLNRWSKVYFNGLVPRLVPPSPIRPSRTRDNRVALGIAGGSLAALTGYALTRRKRTMV